MRVNDPRRRRSSPGGIRSRGHSEKRLLDPITRKIQGGPFRVRVVGDLHVGSEWGLWPPGVVDDNGREYPQNAAQKYLWDCWTHLWSTAPAPDLVVVNGDLIDGPKWTNRLDMSLTTTSLDLQQRALVHVLRAAVAERPWYCVAGTQYHEPERLGVVAAYLGANKGPNGEQVLDELYYRARGKLLEVRHHPGGGSVLYRGTTLNRELILSILAAHRGKTPLPDVVVYGHLHAYAMYQDYGITVVLCPAWQLQTRYARMKNPKRWVPDIGCVDIVLTEDEVPRVEAYLYQTPVPVTVHGDTT